MAQQGKTILVIGASRGLGLGLVREYLERGWRVVATSRGNHDDELKSLASTAGDRLRIERLDVTDANDIAALKRAVGSDPLDLLFVSAGVSNDTSQQAAFVAPDEFTRVMLTNALAPLKIIEVFGGNVGARGAICAMTSVLGSVGSNTSGGYEVYRASKAALNTMLRSYAARNKQRSVIAMHPGWVRTDMGGPHAIVEVEESARGIAEVIEERLGEPGCVFIDYRGETIAW